MIKFAMALTLPGTSGAIMALPFATCPALGWLEKASATDTQAAILYDALKARSQ